MYSKMVEALTAAIDAQDWEQASKDIYKLQKVVLPPPFLLVSGG